MKTITATCSGCVHLAATNFNKMRCIDRLIIRKSSTSISNTLFRRVGKRFTNSRIRIVLVKSYDPITLLQWHLCVLNGSHHLRSENNNCRQIVKIVHVKLGNFTVLCNL